MLNKNIIVFQKSTFALNTYYIIWDIRYSLRVLEV